MLSNDSPVDYVTLIDSEILFTIFTSETYSKLSQESQISKLALALEISAFLNFAFSNAKRSDWSFNLIPLSSLN